MRIGYLRKKKMLDESKLLQDRPKITPHPSHNDTKTPIYLRITPGKYIDEELSKYRENNPAPQPNPLDECTFRPDISNTSGKNNLQRSISDLLQWNCDKKFKQAN
jgi:hypothetical protein